jgi:AraC-like DNA-binding protein
MGDPGERGILRPKLADGVFSLSRPEVSADLTQLLEGMYVIRWDLRGQPPYVQETLPYPCVNLVIEQQASAIYGVVTSRFSRTLSHRGVALGIKFAPGAFRAVLGRSVTTITDRQLAIDDVLEPTGEHWERQLLGLEDEPMARAAERLLRDQVPALDDQARQARQLVQLVIDQPVLTKVDQLVERAAISKRSLQRLFQEYVGVSPKWVIRRFRLQEAAQQLSTATDLARLAHELGYFDQAHFARDFKAVIGSSPSTYAAQSQATRPARG